ncbi:hypothetical protein QFZ43_007058 [Streptomyces afghaniensis]|nr:hypothetical protein [Streptomyces afghaniensis]
MGSVDEVAGVAAVGPHPGDLRLGEAQAPEDVAGGVAVLDVGWPLRGYNPAKSVSENSSPSSSRIRMARLPFGNAARATRAVSSGTPPIFLACSDSDTLPRHNVGLHDHNGS